MHDLLDNIGTKGYKRQKNSSEPKSKVKFTQGNQTEQVIKDDNVETFKYTSPDNNFILEISFNNAKVFDNRDVLRALKEVYVETNKST
jgi:hypothetical protein